MPKLRDTRNASKQKSLKTNAQWLKNATRSLGTNTLDVLKDISPNIYEVSETSAKTAGKILKNISSSKSNQNRISSVLSQNTYVKMAKTGLNNALRDLKNGNFNGEIKAMSDTGDNEATKTYFDNIDSSDGSTQNVVINQVDKQGMARISDSVNRQSETTIKAAKATIDSIVAVSSAQMMQSQQIGNAVIGELQNINTSLQAIVAYNNENMTKYIQSSIAFMEKVGPTIAPENKENPTGPQDLFKNGKFSLKKYKDLVKKQGKSAYDTSTLGQFSTMFSMIGDDLVKNPLEFASKFLIEKAIPDVVKTSMQEVDKAFGEFMPTMLSKLYDEWGNTLEGGMKGEIKKLIGKTFGLNMTPKKGLSFEGKISNDAAVFDKVTRTAIIEELPKYARESTSYLREIVTLMGGDPKKALKNSEILNRRTGEYQKKSEYDKETMASITQAIRSAFNDSEFGKSVNRVGNKMNEKDRQKYNEGLDKFYLALQSINKSNIDISDKSKDGDLYKIINKLDGVDDSMKKVLLNAISNTYSSQKGGLGFAAANINAKAARNRQLMDMESDF